MSDDTGASAEQARQTPWWKRTKDERRAIYRQREAKRKATLKTRLDHIDQRFSPPSQAPAQQTPGHEQPARLGQPMMTTQSTDRHLNRALRLFTISMWLELIPAILGTVAVLGLLVIALIIIL